jgi:lauroyl/myristoyl acyltransferase
MLTRPDIVKDIGRILFWYPFRWCVSPLPFSALYRLGTVLGSLDFRLSKQKRITKMIGNLSENTVGGCEAMSVILENFQNHSRDNLEFLKYPRLSPASIGEYVLLDGAHILDQELKRGKGVILATAHFGAKQALQVGLGHNGYKVSQIHFHMSAEELTFVQKNVAQRFRKKIEEKIPVKFMAAEGFMRGAYECLRKGEILLVAADGIGLKAHMNESYAPFDFLGRKMLFPTGMASLAKRTGAAIVPVFTVREGAKHRLAFEPALNVALEEPAIVNGYVRVLETYVRRYPALWEFWEEFDEENLLAASGAD